MSAAMLHFMLWAGLAVVLALGFSRIKAFQPYFRKGPLITFLLGISSGFPLTLLLATMTFWLSRVGVDKTTIGFAVGLTTPYTFKFLWAPLVDKLPLPVLTRAFGQRRGWLFFVQALLFVAIWQLGASDPKSGMAAFAFWAIIVSFLSATQDIVIDAYRIEILDELDLSHGTATNQFGYRTGNLIAGAGTIFLASPEGLNLGWASAYGFTAFALLPAVVGAIWAGEGRYIDRFQDKKAVRLGDWLKEALVNPFAEFLKRNGAVLILAFVLIYKIGDAMGQIMLAPMIVDLQFSDMEYISASKAWGFGALIVGSALGAPFILWLGMGRALFFSGLMMMFSNVMFMLLAVSGHDYPMLVSAVVIENVTSGIGLTVFTTYLSGLSNLAYTATQFALLTSVASVARTWLSTPAGELSKQLGWVGFWGFTIAIALPGMILLYILWKKGFVVDAQRQGIATAADD
ncbi:MAG: AmpG family muropeptide MFS transporter [Chakrabartia sp.]